MEFKQIFLVLRAIFNISEIHVFFFNLKMLY